MRADVWALTATAEQADSTARDDLSARVEEWIRAGGRGIGLTTCHRVELYGLGHPPALDGLDALSGRDAVEHLLRVAAGLESVIVGEDDVLHQVRDALRSARARGEADSRLARLFEVAVATGRRARSRRTESSGNLAQSAVAWLRSRVDVRGRSVVVAGAGRMGAALAHSLTAAGANVTVASRDARHASVVAGAYGGSGVDLDGGARVAGRAAAVAVALAGPWSELDFARGQALPPVADISAPQSVPDAVRRRLNGDFLGIDDLYRRPRPLPSAYTAHARGVVAAATDRYVDWLARSR